MPRKQKPECTFRPLYETVMEFLIEEGLKRKDLTKCKKRPHDIDDCPCPGLLKNLLLLYNHLPSEQSDEVLEFLSYAFSTSEIFHSGFHPKYLVRNAFHCPELGITMYQPCTVTSCTFHATNRAWTGNCILLYLVKQSDEKQEKRTALSYNELTILLDKPTSDLRKSLNSALRKLRQSVLKTHIEQENKTNRQYRILSTGICPVCENPITQSNKVVKRKVTYCSSTCCSFKPPHILQVEEDFGLPIKNVIQSCVENFSSINFMCNSVGLSKEVFEYYCSMYNIQPS